MHILPRLFKKPEKRRTESKTKVRVHVSRQGIASIDPRQLIESELIQDRMKSLAEAEKNFTIEK